MTPVLYGANTTTFGNFGIGHLSDAISPHVIEERNGEYTFSMQYPIFGEHFSDIQMRSIILAKPSPVQNPQPFRVYRITKPINGIVTVEARHVRYDLEGVPVTPFTASGIAQALQKIKQNSLADNPFTFITNKTNTQTMTLETPASALSLLGGVQGSLLDIYGGEYKYNGFEISLLNARGADNGVVIRYGVDLIDLQQEENCASVFTGVMCFWKSTADDTLVTGGIQSAGTFDYTRIKVVDKSQDYEDAPTVATLNQDAVNFINTNRVGVPKVSLNLSFANLEQTEEYANIRQSIELCDQITVKFERLGVEAMAKVIRTDYDVMLERYISVDIGDHRSSLADSFVAVQTMAENAPTTAEMQQAINTTTAAITGAKGGSDRLLDTDNDKVPDTLYIADNPSPLLASKVWRFNYEGWGASSNGYDGPFTLGATFAAGIVADFITTGTLNASRVNVTNINASNISTGTINANRIGANSITVAKLTGRITAGTGSDAWILNLTDGTFTIGTISADKITSGTIDASVITVTNLNADNITVGSINGSRITDNTVTGGKIADNTLTGGKIADNTLTGGKIADSAITGVKISNNTIVGGKLVDYTLDDLQIATDGIVNRNISSGSIFPTTCNSTINGYFADVIEFNQLRAGNLVVDYLSAGLVSWDRFRLSNDSWTQYTMYIDPNTGALYAHT